MTRNDSRAIFGTPPACDVPRAPQAHGERTGPVTVPARSGDRGLVNPVPHGTPDPPEPAPSLYSGAIAHREDRSGGAPALLLRVARRQAITARWLTSPTVTATGT